MCRSTLQLQENGIDTAVATVAMCHLNNCMAHVLISLFNFHADIAGSVFLIIPVSPCAHQGAHCAILATSAIICECAQSACDVFRRPIESPMGKRMTLCQALSTTSHVGHHRRHHHHLHMCGLMRPCVIFVLVFVHLHLRASMSSSGTQLHPVSFDCF